MNRRNATFSLLAALLPLAAAATPSASGTYQGQIAGMANQLVLQSAGGQVSGSFVEGAMQLAVRGTQQGAQLSLQLVEPNSGSAVATLEGRLEGGTFVATVRAANLQTGQVSTETARFVRVGAAAAAAATGGTPAATAAAPAGGALDPRLLGAWHNEKHINSGGGAGGFASFSTVRTLEFDASGRVTQWVQSSGGGGNWSYGGGGRKAEYSGRWYAKDGIVYVQLDGTSGFQPASRYRFAGEYLVTENNEGRLNWRR